MKDKVNLKKNAIISLLYQLIVACSGFILPKFFITQYGSAINGSISTISQITGFLGLLEAGMGSVASVSFYRALSCPDSCDLTIVRNTVRRYYRIIAIVSVSICLFLSFILPLVLNNGESFSFNFELVLIVGGGFFIQYYLGITSQLLLAADYKAYVNTLTQLIATVMNFVVSIIMIRNNVDVRVVKLISALVLLVRPIILAVYVHCKYHFTKDSTCDNKLMKQRWNNLGQSVAFYIHTQTDMVIIMLFLTIAENSVYAVYMSIVSAIKTLITAIVSNYSPIIGRLSANDSVSKDEFSLVFLKFIRVNNFFINILFPVMAVLIIPFMKLYSRNFDYNYIRPNLAIFLCLSEYIYLFRTPYNTLINVNGHFKETQKSAFIEAGLNIVLSVLLIGWLGTVGVVIGTAVAMLYKTVYCVLYVKRHLFDIPLFEVVKSLLLTLITMISVFVVYIFVNMVEIPNYWLFILAGFVFTAIFTIEQCFFNFIFYKWKRLRK